MKTIKNAIWVVRYSLLIKHTRVQPLLATSYHMIVEALNISCMDIVQTGHATRLVPEL